MTAHTDMTTHAALIPETAKAAEEWLREAVRLTGGGFHLETSGDQYVDKATGTRTLNEDQARWWDRCVDACHELLEDPYEPCLDEMHKLFG